MKLIFIFSVIFFQSATFSCNTEASNAHGYAFEELSGCEEDECCKKYCDCTCCIGMNTYITEKFTVIFPVKNQMISFNPAKRKMTGFNRVHWQPPKTLLI